MLKILLLVLVVAVAIYAITRLAGRRSGAVRPRREPPRIVPPDDDPDFLRDLDRKRRHKDEPESPA